MSQSGKVRDFAIALQEYVQEPGWLMFKPSNLKYKNATAISTWFVDNKFELEDLIRRYLKMKGAIRVDMDLHMASIVRSEQWQKLALEYVAACGQYIGVGAHCLCAGVFPEDHNLGVDTA